MLNCLEQMKVDVTFPVCERLRKFVSFVILSVFIGFMYTPFVLAKDVKKAEPKTKASSSELVKYEIFNLIQSKSIPKSLTGKRGNVKRGETLIVNREKGNCLSCHVVDEFHEKAKKNPDIYGNMGEIGPSLDGVATRFKESQLRLILVNAKEVFPETIMPAFYRVKGFTRVDDNFIDKPIMSAQDIEDILSFLMKLK